MTLTVLTPVPRLQLPGLLRMADVLSGHAAPAFARPVLSRALEGLSAERAMVRLAVVMSGGHAGRLVLTLARGRSKAAAVPTIALLVLFIVLCLPIAITSD